MRPYGWVAAATLAAACGDNLAGAPLIGPATELALLESDDPARPWNHNVEVAVTVHRGRVVVASINLHLASEDSYEVTPAFRRRVAVQVSTDAGRTFSAAIDPGVGEFTTDPVIRNTSDGTLFLSTFTEPPSPLAKSSDGVTWEVVARADWYDKEWLAVDDVDQNVYAAGLRGMFRFGFDGAPRGE